ncbi:MAG TPA: sigma-70 family RNA polymerase sigma factor [Gemmataceae bacterium]|jgi:RNA polymerase sigma-70 factor (ECF subfamily)|nr:sigma-70 family RNA polymerase sigma factor [Gemmataceae bacterium]
MPSDSDRLLIQQIRSDDPATRDRAWEQLIARYEGRLLAFANRKLRDRAASEDVVQEAFVGFLNSLPNFDEKRELQTYLFTITAHKITDQLRKMGRRPVQTGTEATAEALNNQVDSGQPRASSIARSNERKDIESDAIARGLGQLIRQWQQKGDYLRLQVLELLLVKGWANRDVAKRLRIADQDVANYRFAAMRKLAEHIKDAGLPADVFPELTEDQEGS